MRHLSSRPPTPPKRLASFVTSQPELQDVGCPLGCAKGDDVVLVGGDRLHSLPGEFTVVRCKACSLMRTNPRPGPETIGAYYPDDYGPHQQTAPAPSDVRTWKSTIRAALDTRSEALPSLVPGRLLEIGCASGDFLAKMATAGWKVEGLEFADAPAARARQAGFRVHSGPLETVDGPEGTYDLIVGWMVLEHLHDPVAALRRLRNWAGPATWLAVSVPNAGSIEFRLFRDRWYALQLPTHLFHYTPDTIRKVLARGGWRTERVLHQRSLANSAGSAALALQDRERMPRLGSRLATFPKSPGRLGNALFPLAWGLAVAGQTGRMTVWARPS